MTIFPTHSCFTDALEYVAARVSQDPRLAEKRRLVLVHGLAYIPAGSPGAGTRFAHAWVEEAGQCYTWGLLLGVRILIARDRAEFYRSLRVHQATTYTVRQAWQENRRSGMYGPWKPDYLALCDKRPAADASSEARR